MNITLRILMLFLSGVGCSLYGAQQAIDAIKDHEKQEREMLQKVLAFQNRMEYRYRLEPQDKIDVNISYGSDNILHLALQEAEKDIIKWLIEKEKADVNVPNHLGFTPLFYVKDEEIALYYWIAERISLL